MTDRENIAYVNVHTGTLDGMLSRNEAVALISERLKISRTEAKNRLARDGRVEVPHYWLHPANVSDRWEWMKRGHVVLP